MRRGQPTNRGSVRMSASRIVSVEDSSAPSRPWVRGRVPIRAHVSASTPAVRNRPKPPAPSGTPIAAYRAPARSRAASRITRSTGSVRRSAPSASATSSSRRSATASVLPTPAILRRSAPDVGAAIYGAGVEVALGFRPHSGWAVAVVVGLGPVVLGAAPARSAWADPAVPRRGRAAAGRGGGAGRRRRPTAAYERAAAALAELAAGHEVVGAAIVAGAGTVREDVPLARALTAHAMLHAAEGELYRDALADAADALGLPVTLVPPRDTPALGRRVLGCDDEDLRGRLTELGRPFGPPWTRDHKDAVVAALALLEP